MKRPKLKHSYHDAIIKAVRYRGDADVLLEIDLCTCCNASAGPATLCLLGLRNFAAVHEALESAHKQNAERGYVDEIVGVFRDQERGYLFDLITAGTVRVDARGLDEA
jgi:hypothetical protein